MIKQSYHMVQKTFFEANVLLFIFLLDNLLLKFNLLRFDKFIKKEMCFLEDFRNFVFCREPLHGCLWTFLNFRSSFWGIGKWFGAKMASVETTFLKENPNNEELSRYFVKILWSAISKQFHIPACSCMLTTTKKFHAGYVRKTLWK